jgi:mannose-6-phosphate isomerase-like protein (cupin superfamily)
MMPALVPLVLAAALAADPAPQAAQVVHLTSADVKARTAGGDPLLLTAEGYKVMLSTRTGGGEAEVHATDTDVFYVSAGTATFVTGGTVAGAKETAPGETRGPSIQGGVTKTIAAGDVLVIPAGTPHWFKAVEGKVEYFVVKVAR